VSCGVIFEKDVIASVAKQSSARVARKQNALRFVPAAVLVGAPAGAQAGLLRRHSRSKNGVASLAFASQ
jgi:hypothetical protein